MKPGPEENETKRVLVSGKVQGVFFRSSLKKVADSLKLDGWTRNLPDGSVEAVLQGNPVDVAKAVEWCRTGPKMARVEEVSVSSISNPEHFRNFEILG
ncbi:MAG: acylphosphatase [Nitrososphaerales archaeon]